VDGIEHSPKVTFHVNPDVMRGASYLLPSSLQKRLLRYALSRLELLDTEALDLENLDVVWGKRSVVELRDVGLRLKVRL